MKYPDVATGNDMVVATREKNKKCAFELLTIKYKSGSHQDDSLLHIFGNVLCRVHG